MLLLIERIDPPPNEENPDEGLTARPGPVEVPGDGDEATVAHPSYRTVLSIQVRNRALSVEDALVEHIRVDAALRLLPAVAIPVALALWQWSLHGIDLRRMNDLGLASV